MRPLATRLIPVGMLTPSQVACADAESTTYSSPPEGQYTPNQADWSTFATKPVEGGPNTSHDPEGVGWISAAD